mgnify:CR=1 FL=1
MLTGVTHEDPTLKTNNVTFDLTVNCNYVIPDAVAQALINEGRATLYEGQVYWNNSTL